MPQYLKDHPVYYAGPAKDTRRYGIRFVRPDHGRPHGLVRPSSSRPPVAR